MGCRPLVDRLEEGVGVLEFLAAEPHVARAAVEDEFVVAQAGVIDPRSEPTYQSAKPYRVGTDRRRKLARVSRAEGSATATAITTVRVDDGAAALPRYMTPGARWPP